jgi:hypothetical protein
MFWADLPPSINIEDRRGQAPQPMTIAEIFNLLSARQMEDASRVPCALSRALGIHDIKNPRWLRGR